MFPVKHIKRPFRNAQQWNSVSRSACHSETPPLRVILKAKLEESPNAKVAHRKRITALKSCDFKAVTYMIRGKMMSKFFVSVCTTDLHVLFYHLPKEK